MQHEHGVREAQPLLDALLREYDRANPAVVRTKALDRFELGIELPLSLVILVETLRIPLVDAVVGLSKRQPLSQPGQHTGAAAGDLEKRTVEDEAPDEVAV